MKSTVRLIALVPMLFFGIRTEDPIPLPHAHAHNDYQHPRPLSDALDQGFCSVEADIFLMPNGQLLVGHDKKELQTERTLEKLYLAPLRERATRNQGRILPPNQTFYPLIDVKSDAKPTYAALHRQLTRYADILTEVNQGKLIERASWS